MNTNITDLLLQRLGLSTKAELGRIFRVSRQTVNNWKNTNRINQRYFHRAVELGLVLDDFCPKETEKPVADTHACVPMKDVINDPTHYIEIARGGITVEVTVSGKIVAKITGASVAA